MTTPSTPVCNCPEDIGWYPESDFVTLYGTAAKTIAQPIYCVQLAGNTDSTPVVAPRGGFLSDLADARCDWSGGDRAIYPTGDIRTLAGAGTVDLTVTNPYVYPIQLMGETQVSSIMTLNGDSYLDQIEFVVEIKVDGAPTSPATIYRAYEFGVETVTSAVTSSSFQRKAHMLWSSSRKLPQLAPGASMTIGLYPTWATSGGMAGTIDTWASAVRIWGGTAPPV